MTDDNLSLPTITSHDFVEMYESVEDDEVGDRSHIAVTGGEVRIEYGSQVQTLPVCSPDEVRTVRVQAFAMEEPYYDNGCYNESGAMVGDNDGVWNYIDLNGNSTVDLDDLFEEYVEVSRFNDGGGNPRRLYPRTSIPRGQRRGSVASQAYHAGVADRARLSWDQACIRVDVEPLTVYDPGPAFFNSTFKDEVFNLLLPDRDPRTIPGWGETEELALIESLNARLLPGRVAVIYTATMEARTLDPARAALVELRAEGFAVSSPLLQEYAAFSGVAQVRALLGDRAVMLVNPTAVVSKRVLAHELGHVLSVEGDPYEPNEVVKEWFFFPNAFPRPDATIGTMRRLPVETIRRARLSPYVE